MGWSIALVDELTSLQLASTRKVTLAIGWVVYWSVTNLLSQPFAPCNRQVLMVVSLNQSAWFFLVPNQSILVRDELN